MSDSATPCTAACQVPLFSTISQSLLKLMSIDSMMLSNHLILCCPLLLLCSIFLASKSFPIAQFYASSGQSTVASVSVLSVNTQVWFPLGLTGLISLQSEGFSRVFSSTTIWKHQFTSAQLSLWSSSHIHTWLMGNLQFWLYGPLSAKWHLCILAQY